MASPQELLTSDSVIYRNLKCVAYKKTDHPLEERVVSMTTIGNYVILGIAKYGCHVYSVQNDKVHRICVLGEQPKLGGRKSPAGGSTCYSICSCTKRIVYIKESEGECCICVHTFEDVIAGRTTPVQSLTIHRRAPLIYDPLLELVAIGGGAWASSWVGAKGEGAQDKGGGDNYLHTLDVRDLSTIKQWEAVDNAVYLLRIQSSESQNMLGVADTRNGLKVFNLQQPEGEGYCCLYFVPVEEVRNFQLVGDYVGVFHKFEPNVSFWNMKEQKTILCINIQEQMKQLAEEYYDDEDDDSGLFDEEDDTVTAVTSVPFENDHILIYGTRAGCVFGMAVNLRSKIFSIPYAHESENQHEMRNDVLGVSLLPDGKLITCYQGSGLTMLDFSPEDPPDRPPTRGQAK